MSWIGFLRLGRPGTLDSTPKVSRLCYECLLLLVRQTGGTKCTVNGCSLNSNVVSIYRRTENRRSFTTILPSPLSVGKVSPPRRPKCCLMFYRGWGGGGENTNIGLSPKHFYVHFAPNAPSFQSLLCVCPYCSRYSAPVSELRQIYCTGAEPCVCPNRNSREAALLPPGPVSKGFGNPSHERSYEYNKERQHFDYFTNTESAIRSVPMSSN